MVFYVVKGAPDACGRGCDSWIAVEGPIDSGAALRFRKFWAKVRDRKLPIYFSSPGGNLDQALAMGAMLRERPVVARVARTVVRECGFEAQDSDVCIKLKQSGRELHGDLWTRNAMCNSACPYLILGATTREIAPDALLAVHSPKVVAHFRGGVPPPELQAEANARGRVRADGMIRDYIVKMGVDLGLLVLARTVKYEDARVLTREEIDRFGIDRRDVVETPWTFENVGRSVVHKTALQKLASDGSFRSSQWRLFCINAEQFELGLQRQAVTQALLPVVSMSNGEAKPFYFVSTRAAQPGFNYWATRMTRASVQSLSELGQFDLTETSQGPDGRRLARSAKFSSEGLGSAVNTLLATCPPPRSIAALQAAGSRENAAK
ncbi:MAG: uncharacterized protein JWR80_3936 [Bradyrhizobium sp.]|nr:uncharacterized protein [Bradyrhizobium sp.]